MARVLLGLCQSKSSSWPMPRVSQAMDYSGDRVVGRKKTLGYKHSLDRSSKYNPFPIVNMTFVWSPTSVYYSARQLSV